jgi:hypothetical protein
MSITKTVPINLSKINFTEKLPLWAARKDKLEVLKQYYLRHMCEDPIDGNRFDLDVLDAIEALQKKYDGDED